VTAVDPPPSASASLAGRTAAALALMFAWVLLSFVLPNIALDSPVADLAVRVSDSADWEQMPFWCIATLVLVVSRPGSSKRRRVVEAVALSVAMLVVIPGHALINEKLTKPAFAVPRPNIVALTEARALGPSIRDPADFYAIGDKPARSEFLSKRLAKLDEPALSQHVHDHWLDETGYSFPSGHATASMTFASLFVAIGFLWLSGWRQRITNTLLPIWAVGVVYSRPLLEVHTAIDVASGTLVGFALGLAAFVFVRWTTDKLSG
jgi:phosphatidylglycerophosphatase B